MRRFSSEVFDAAGIEFDFRVHGAVEDVEIDLEQRRHLYLLFREGIRNILRHSSCKRASVELSFDGECLTILIRDDGAGFDFAGVHRGQGTSSMCERARSLGGRIEWKSDAGTTVMVRVPLHK